MSQLELPGLPGDNPLGFLAALGAQAAASEIDASVLLRWSDDPVPHAVLAGIQDHGAVAEAAMSLAGAWLNGPALAADLDPKLKLEPDGIRQYLTEARAAGSTGSLAMCLVAENSLDNSGKAKPSDFYFTAGQMKFVVMAREILGDVTQEELIADLTGPWRYVSSKPSLMWDVADDRVYALTSANPSTEKKQTNPGAEALALLGLSRYPCFRAATGTVSTGCSGSWKRGSFTWPLWDQLATSAVVGALLAHGSMPAPSGAESTRAFEGHARQYGGWGVMRVMQSQIRRSDQGGYGTFGPARVIWQRG